MPTWGSTGDFWMMREERLRSRVGALANDQDHRVAASDVDCSFSPDGNSGAFCYAAFD
jgi:hypothetical protein